MKKEERLTYTVKECAEKLGISRNFAYKAARKGIAPFDDAIRIGKKIIIPKAKIDALLS